MIKPEIPHRIRSSISSVIFWFLISLSFLLSFLFCSLFLFSGWASNIESLGVFTFSGGNRCGGVACFAADIYLFFYVVYWLWVSLWKREEVALNLKAMLLSRSFSALLIDKLNFFG